MTFVALGLSVGVLALAAWTATGSGRRLLFALVVLAFGIGSVNPLIEAVAFGVMPLGDAGFTMVTHFGLALVLSAVAMTVARKWPENSVAPVSPRLGVGRIAVAALCYAMLYLAAGIAVYPYIKEFYATKELPPLSLVLGLQLVRGSLYVGYAWLWLRLALRRPALTLGLLYSILGAVAPLLVADNPYMPEEIRMLHLIEAGISNFLFGLVVGWLAGRPVKEQRGGPVPAVQT